jgi:hypothetical protein
VWSIPQAFPEGGSDVIGGHRDHRIGLARLLAGALLTACASGGGPVAPASPSRAMIFGHLGLPVEVRDEIQWIHVYKLGEVYAPPFKKPPTVRFFPNGDFFAENLKPGKYYVHHLVAGMEAFYLYPPDMKESKEVVLDRVVEVGEGEVAYLGSHRIYDWKRGVSSKLSPKIGSFRLMSSTPGAGPEPLPNFMNHSGLMTAGSGTFSMKRTLRRADEKRVLKHVLPEVEGTGWDTRIEARLAALR